MVNKVLEAVKNVGLKSAKGAVNSASYWFLYQTKEPDMLKERLKKQK